MRITAEPPVEVEYKLHLNHTELELLRRTMHGIGFAVGSDIERFRIQLELLTEKYVIKPR